MKLIDWAKLRATIGRWADRLTLPERFILPIFTLQWGCGSVARPNLLNVSASLGHGRHDDSLYYNGIVFVRVMLPFFVGVHVRWSGDPARKKQFVQAHVGWKKNGDFAVTFRLQNDASSLAGTYGRNFGQAQGWSCGTH